MKKTILITGSTDGIGRSTASMLAKEGHRLFLHGRNEQKLDRVISELKAESGNNMLSGFVADFSDLQAVREMAAAVNSKLDSLDVLINNAGVFQSKARNNGQGIDLRLVVNYLAPYLLTNELLPLLRSSDAGRVVNLSSAAQSTVSLAALKGETQLDTQSAYAQSKLAILMWSFALAKQEKSLTVIPVNPGSLLNTKMVQEAYGTHFAEVEKGSGKLHELALGEGHRKMSGKYFDNDRGAYGPAHADAYDDGLVAQLINASESLTLNPDRPT